MATIYADRTRLNGDYHLGTRGGTFGMAGDFAADSATLDPSHVRRRDSSRSRPRPRPRLGRSPQPSAMRSGRTAGNFNAAGKIRVVNFPGGGAVRIDTADVIGPSGARARVFGAAG